MKKYPLMAPWTFHLASEGNRFLIRNSEDSPMAAVYMTNDSAVAMGRARLISASPDLLEACKAQHDALDTAMAMLIVLTRDLYPNEPDKHFMPSQSPMFNAIKIGNAAIAKAEGAS